jgi:Ca2+-dependent lipid-binding protein
MAGLPEPVEIFFSAAALPNLDLLSKTDPFLVVYEVNRDRSRKILFMTEVIEDNLSPVWTKPFRIDYIFEKIQELCVMVMDKDDGPQEDLDKHQRCGESQFRLSELMCARGQSITHRLLGGTGKGSVTFKAENVANTRDVFECSFSGTKLANKDGFFGKSDPFLIIQR